MLSAMASPSAVQSPAAARTLVSAAPVLPTPTLSVPVRPDDPLQGKFSLEQATAGLRGEGQLWALMRTSAGNLACELWPEKAPNTVANFVGLARGLRPYLLDNAWVKKPLYDATEFYLVNKGFAIEGGSPGPQFNADVGYFIPDEIWAGAHHDQRGLLCMRAFTPGRNGSQFMILDGATPQLDQSFTIFGKCEPTKVLDAISNAPVVGGRPKPAIKLRKLEIIRNPQRPN
jgi:peptidyl-prolyl cis-trans isomerase A (cyclophilin A)